ncbi:hypothetical protein AKJ65_00965 [candidate division MSBL1 archaeon SCGC-AAA259E19]|uniref:Ribosomal RNA small subunit methyltransferase Nep1 n=1 Tax=candidate division MSBL1 archaeon SCGC-AAA259E19 TaxID=1698264 RepID=A0A133UNC6_9EURY|nr:hypothetical protein AKJ65_00965 [candidate division MSBL1 archaeon SCGC-AAA259E19]
MLHLILADSELETVPLEISSDKSIGRKARKRGRRPTELILDSNYFHRPMKKLDDSERRGRPDIVHVCMLTALDSPLNHEDFLRFSVHTRQDKIIEVDPETRIPRSYNRFVGLMEQLFLTGEVPPENPLMKIEDATLPEKVKEVKPEKVVTLREDGERIRRENLFRELSRKDDLLAIVGGFPHGEFLSDVHSLSDQIIRIYPKTLEAVTAVTHIIQFYEEEHLENSLFDG